MLDPDAHHGAKEGGVALLSALCVFLAIVCWRAVRGRNRCWWALLVASYNLILLALFIAGLVWDDGYGWAFLPLMIAVAPWSFLAPLLARGAVGGWFASGIVGNFVLFVVLCGGINSLLLYLLARRVLHPSSDPISLRL
jgi:hypothetical protein